jgi:hypothetical protein
MDPLDAVVDLGEFRDLLAPKYRALKQCINDALDVHSACSDLKLAAEFAARSAEMAKDSPLDREAAEECTMALLCSAIIFYGRAIKNRSKHRKTFDLRNHFDARELENHDLICRLRDDAIAHYGPGRLTDQVLLREDKAFVAVETGQLMFATRNICSSESLSKIVLAQAQRASIVAQRLHEERQEILLDALHEAIVDPVIAQAWHDAIRDLSSGMGDDRAAAELRALPRTGIHRISGRLVPQRSR